jgi:hypothetical protein
VIQTYTKPVTAGPYGWLVDAIRSKLKGGCVVEILPFSPDRLILAVERGGQCHFQLIEGTIHHESSIVPTTSIISLNSCGPERRAAFVKQVVAQVSPDAGFDAVYRAIMGGGG